VRAAGTLLAFNGGAPFTFMRSNGDPTLHVGALLYTLRWKRDALVLLNSAAHTPTAAHVADAAAQRDALTAILRGAPGAAGDGAVHVPAALALHHTARVVPFLSGVVFEPDVLAAAIAAGIVPMVRKSGECACSTTTVTLTSRLAPTRCCHRCAADLVPLLGLTWARGAGSCRRQVWNARPGSNCLPPWRRRWRSRCADASAPKLPKEGSCVTLGSVWTRVGSLAAGCRRRGAALSQRHVLPHIQPRAHAAERLAAAAAAALGAARRRGSRCCFRRGQCHRCGGARVLGTCAAAAAGCGKRRMHSRRATLGPAGGRCGCGVGVGAPFGAHATDTLSQQDAPPVARARARCSASHYARPPPPLRELPAPAPRLSLRSRAPSLLRSRHDDAIRLPAARRVHAAQPVQRRVRHR
jgi:hypothetical protein